MAGPSYRSFRPFSTVIPGSNKLTSGAESCVKKQKAIFLVFLVFVLLRPDGFFNHGPSKASLKNEQKSSTILQNTTIKGMLLVCKHTTVGLYPGW